MPVARVFGLWVVVSALALAATPARAVLDVEDKGPVLDAGNFRMRVTNAGILGNAFFNTNRSSDPSFEYPAYSGNELLNHAELWVGAVDEDNQAHVSGGPMLEWRPTLDPADHVYLKHRTDLGTRRLFDDDGDGKVDEEVLNGKDDDGDGEIDEDLALYADEEAGCDYVDDRPEAVNFGYPTGETHVPLGLTVHQTASSWSAPGYDGIAGYEFHITNHGAKTLRNVYIGLLADLDSRRADDHSGHRNDEIVFRSYSASKLEGLARVTYQGHLTCGFKNCPPTQCYTNFSATLPVLVDGAPNTTLPAIALMPLDHTVDPITRIDPNLGRAPLQVSFRTSLFSGEGIPGQGGLPTLDVDRYAALAGSYPTQPTTVKTDWVELVSCGPFRELRPGQSLDFTIAFVAGANADSVAAVFPRLALLHHGLQLDLLPNETTHPDSVEYTVAKTGVGGHEICLEPPPGTTFFLDPDCSHKFSTPDSPVPDMPITYYPGQCIWTDLDCDVCTGLNGKETTQRWLDPGEVPPPPTTRVTPGDHEVTIEWDNLPELLIQARRLGGPSSVFRAYRLFKLARWRDRQTLLPPLENWQLVATFSPTSSGNSEVPLDSVTDASVEYDRILYEQKLYPPGRYRYVDRDVMNGFDYIYVVTTEYLGAVPHGGDASTGYDRVILDGPLVASFEDRVTPRTNAISAGTHVTVVPNPYRGSAGWDRPPVFGDALPRHIDFMHLPKAVATIKIFTLAGDFVAQIVHDGTNGDGEASWNLISRNGQDVESGVYLFSVDSPLGHEVGKFVIVR